MRIMVDLITIYNWDDTIFDDFHIPQGMDKETLINLMMRRLANLRIIYSEPETLKAYIGYWSIVRKKVWDHLWALAETSYDPLRNYDRTESRTTEYGKSTRNVSRRSEETSVTDTLRGTEQSTDTGTDTDNVNTTIRETDSENTSDARTITKQAASHTEGETAETKNETGSKDTSGSGSFSESGTNTIYGYNAETAANKDGYSKSGSNSQSGDEDTTYNSQLATTNEQDSTLSENTTDNDTIATSKTHNGDNIQTETKTHSLSHSGEHAGTNNRAGHAAIDDSNTETNSGEDTETAHAYGNIGVTTAQQMAEQELQLRPKLDIYSYIVEEFKAEFCVMLY